MQFANASEEARSQAVVASATTAQASAFSISVGVGGSGGYAVETTLPERELRHNIPDMELDMLHRGRTQSQSSERAFDVSLAALCLAAGATPQVIRDLYGAFVAKQPTPIDLLGCLGLVVFAGALAVGLTAKFVFGGKREPSDVDKKVAEIRQRTNRMIQLVSNNEMRPKP